MVSRLSLYALCCSIAFTLPALAQSPSPGVPSKASIAKTPTDFDQFIVVLLVRPPNLPDLAKEEVEKLQEGHMATINRLAAEKKLLKAGPFEDFSGRNVRGMFILTTDSLEKAREWVSEDPLVKLGRLTPEFLKWYVEKGSLK